MSRKSVRIVPAGKRHEATSSCRVELPLANGRQHSFSDSLWSLTDASHLGRRTTRIHLDDLCANSDRHPVTRQPPQRAIEGCDEDRGVDPGDLLPLLEQNVPAVLVDARTSSALCFRILGKGRVYIGMSRRAESSSRTRAMSRARTASTPSSLARPSNTASAKAMPRLVGAGLGSSWMATA